MEHSKFNLDKTLDEISYEMSEIRDRLSDAKYSLGFLTHMYRDGDLSADERMHIARILLKYKNGLKSEHIGMSNSERELRAGASAVRMNNEHAQEQKVKPKTIPVNEIDYIPF